MRKVQKRKIKGIVVKDTYKCGRCEVIFNSMPSLKRHSSIHLKDLQELKWLEKGHMPTETKFASPFRGKNRVIIS